MTRKSRGFESHSLRQEVQKSPWKQGLFCFSGQCEKDLVGECRQLRARVISLTPVVPDIAARTGGSISFGYAQIRCQLSQLTLMGNVIDAGIV